MKPIENRKHHFVPQLLLRNFAPNRRTLFAFDKWEEKYFPISVKDAGAERGFYSYYAVGEGAACLEEYFQELEDPAAPLIRTIVEKRTLPRFTSLERTRLCRFAVAQVGRSKNHLALWLQSGDVLRALADSEGTPEFKAWVGERDIETERAHLLSGMRDFIEEFVPMFADKNIMLFIRTEKSRPLMIGDSPLVRTNTTVGEGGNLGFASIGIEMYLPLSPDVLLGFMCTTIDKEFRAAIARLGKRAPQVTFDYVLALELNRPILLEDTHVKYYNSLQDGASERHVYSCDDDFSLIREMLDVNPSFRRGERMMSNVDDVIAATEEISE